MITIRSHRARRVWCILSLLALCAVAVNPISSRAARGGSQADLSIGLEANEPMVPMGAEFTVTMTVQNSGPLSALGTSLSSSTPAGTTFVSAETSAGEVTTQPESGGTGSITVAMGDLEADSVASLTLVLFVTAAPGATITTNAQVEPQNQSDDSEQGNNTANVDVGVIEAGTADISVGVEPEDEFAGSGSLFDYTITVTNESEGARSPRNPATGVFAHAVIPDGAVFSSLELSQGEAETPAIGDSGSIFCSLGELGDGESATINLVVEVVANPGHVLSLSVAASSDASDPDSSNNSAEVDVEVEASESATLDWDEPEPPTEAEPFPPPEHLVVEQGSGAFHRIAAIPAHVDKTSTAGGVTGYKVYRSNKPGVAPMPGNLFMSVPVSQTSAGAPVAPGGSFFTVTATYGTGESPPSNEASASVPAATVSKVKVKPTKITATGAGFTNPVTVSIDGIPFSSPASVKKNNTKVVQKGNLLTGQTIGAYLAAHPSVQLSFRNSNGGVTSVRYPN